MGAVSRNGQLFRPDGMELEAFKVIRGNVGFLFIVLGNPFNPFKIISRSTPSEDDLDPVGN